MIGRVLAGRYRVEAAVGEGGMSKVWRAHDLNTGKAVAVKVLKEEFRDDETYIRHFEREAQAASRMSHPNIANLLDVGLEEDGTRYLVFEYVPGITLKQFIKESGALKPDIAAQIIIRVLSAVQHAHQNGVIHRDIKPQNILIDKEGAVKVSDFGIARVANSQTMSQESDVVMGSVYYFSPEQAKGQAVDEKSDIYSVGVMFYEMLTGKVPFTGETPVAIAMKHLEEKPAPPSEITPGVSEALDFVVLHAMEKRPRNRYPSAAAMLGDVRLALEHPDTITAARAEMERRAQRARQAEREQEKKARRIRWVRRGLLVFFSAVLLGIIFFAGYTVTDQIMRDRRNTVEVPSLIGMNKKEAFDKVIELGLDPVIRTDKYPLVPDDVVADQSIAPGTRVAPGEKITIVVCQSQYELTVPNFVGLPIEKAQQMMVENGLIGENNYVISQAAPDSVVGQDPPPGSPANKGDMVTLMVSGGSVTMPQLKSMTRAEAEQTIMAFGLVLGAVHQEVVDDPALVDRVVAQVPATFESVKPRSTVQITMGVPSTNLIATELSLNLSDAPAGTTVSIALEDEAGEESREYVRVFEEGGFPIKVTLYSKTARVARYYVYYGQERVRTGVVTFEPK